MKNLLSNIIKTICVIAVVFFVGFLFVQALDKNEVIECNQWKGDAQEYSGFYLTYSQDAQCRAHGIVIDTQVR
jgi:hypothetical protein